MNFMKKRPPQPITSLQSLFKKATDSSIQNYELEKKNEIKKSFQGWKYLHTTILYELDHLSKSYSLSDLTSEENFIYTEIKYLDGKAKENMNRLEVLLMREIAEMNKSYQNRSIDSSSSSSASTNNQNEPRAMLKTLRSPKSTSNVGNSSKFHSRRYYQSSSNISPSASLISKTAATKIWKDEEKLVQATDEKDTADNLFKDFSGISDLNEVAVSKSSNHSSGEYSSLKSKISAPVPLKPVKCGPSPISERISKFNKLNEPIPTQRPLSPKKLTSEARPAPKTAPKPAPKPKLKSHHSKPNVKSPQQNPVFRLNPSDIALKASKISTNQSSKSHTVKSPALTKYSSLQKPPAAKKTHSAPNSRVNSPKVNSKNNSNASRSNLLATATKKSLSVDSISKKATETSDFNFSNNDEKDTETLSGGNNKTDSDDEQMNGVKELEINETEVQEVMQERIISEIKGIDEAAAKQIFNEIVDQGDEVHWEDIAGLEVAKNSLKEAVVYPFLRPDLFSGLREPTRGMLLFGPPGTGKTMLAKAVATESKSTFFSISASSLTSKYLGESEKLVRALFLLAKRLSPSIIFIDEIDSLLSARTDNENESTRRIKTEFLIQWNGLSHAAVGQNKGDSSQPRVLVLAATNLPWNIDEAARRRFVRRQYIPLPEGETRRAQFVKMLSHQQGASSFSDLELDELVALTDGFSGSDITALTKDAAMNPLRELGDKLLFTPKEEIRGLTLKDFKVSLQYIRPSVSEEGLAKFDEWASKYGSSGA
ncbi:putative AAA family ATPase [Saccharomycopsis crataegensis]|uniref:AAA family ATPase n=1 Tax=Saccharomycopsis crataegensis TaxID=43959 RepID=A0AAV5QQQ2_9ASCO|nr:putative AAA family ATPase [Saccharomycopsis crataegensis]